jgi:polyhydroxyalkanoate synthesis regulator phasin
MDSNAKRKLVVGVAAGLLLVGAGGAFAAEKLTSPKEESQAVINDAAKRLGIEPAKLNDALKGALEDRVDAAVADGRLTKAEGEALKQRIEAGDTPLLFGGVYPHGGPGGPHGGFGFGLHDGGGLAAAAKYLGLTPAELRTQLSNGKSLADVAKAQNKSVSGLVDALTADAKTKLDAAVKAGRLTQSQADDMLAELKSHLTDFVNGNGPDMRMHVGPPDGGAKLDGAAHLGITEEQLRSELANGKTLAQVAKAHGKTAAGLVDALVADVQKKLDAAVKAGKLTQSEADSMAAELKSQITDLVNGKFPAPPFGGPEGFRGGHGFRGFHPGHGPPNGAFFGPPPAARTA